MNKKVKLCHLSRYMENINNASRLSIITCLLLFYLFSNSREASAQSTGLVAQNYNNLYSDNPAFAGLNPGGYLNLHYRNQWRVIPGSPVINAITGDYRFDNRVGVGLKVYSDKAGLISRNSVLASYAYHLPLDGKNQEIHFGLSIGVMKDRLDNEGIIGEENDPDGDLFNVRKVYLDADFGMAYTTERLNIQGALPNMKTFFKKDESNSVQVSTMFLALSYKIGRSLDVVSIEPKISYRGASGVDNIFNLGANVNLLNDLVSFTGIYHSTQSSSVGMGLKYQKYLLQGFYTSQLAGQREPTGGSFELHVRAQFGNNKKAAL